MAQSLSDQAHPGPGSPPDTSTIARYSALLPPHRPGASPYATGVTCASAARSIQTKIVTPRARRAVSQPCGPTGRPAPAPQREAQQTRGVDMCRTCACATPGARCATCGGRTCRCCATSCGRAGAARSTARPAPKKKTEQESLRARAGHAVANRAHKTGLAGGSGCAVGKIAKKRLHLHGGIVTN